MCLNSFHVRMMAVPDRILFTRAHPLRQKFYNGLREIITNNKEAIMDLLCILRFPGMLQDIDIFSARERTFSIEIEGSAERRAYIFEKLLLRLSCTNVTNFLKGIWVFDAHLHLRLSDEIQELKAKCDMSTWFRERCSEVVVKHWFLLCEYNTRACNDIVLKYLMDNDLLTSKELRECEDLSYDESYNVSPMIDGLCRRTDMMLRRMHYKISDLKKWLAFMICVVDLMKMPLVRASMVSMLLR